MCVLLIYQFFGPYHRARWLRMRPAFADAGFQLFGLQLFDKPDTYRWHEKNELPDFLNLELSTDGYDQIRKADVPSLFRTFSRLKPAVVFVNGWGMRDAVLTHAWCRWKGVKRVLVSDSRMEDFPRHFMKEKFKRLILAGCESAFVAGTPHRRYVEALGMAPESIFLGCDVVDNKHFSRATFLRRSRDRRILTVARWEPVKNLLSAALAFLRFVETRPTQENWRWRVVGYGSQENSLRSLAKRSEGRIELLGARDYSELPAVYAEADLYWQPSVMEPWGLVVNEAMAAGLPVLISNRCGCHQDLVTPKTGWTFDPHDETEMVRALERAACCRERWPAMGRAAAGRIARWDLDRFVNGALAATQHALGRAAL